MQCWRSLRCLVYVIASKLERHQRVVRHRGMKKPALIVLASLVVLFGVANCSSSMVRSPLLPVSTVTGFARIPLTGGVPLWPRYGPSIR